MVMVSGMMVVPLCNLRCAVSDACEAQTPTAYCMLAAAVEETPPEAPAEEAAAPPPAEPDAAPPAE